MLDFFFNSEIREECVQNVHALMDTLLALATMERLYLTFYQNKILS